MINDPTIRKILHSLVYGTQGKQPSCKYSIDKDSGALLQKWIATHQGCLQPYIPLVERSVNGQKRVFLHEKAKGIVPVSAHLTMTVTVTVTMTVTVTETVTVTVTVHI